MAPISQTSVYQLNWQKLARNVETKSTGDLTLVVYIRDGYTGLHKLFLASVRVRTPDFFFVYVLTNVLEEKTCTSVLYAHLGKVRRGLKYFLEIFTIISLKSYNQKSLVKT